MAVDPFALVDEPDGSARQKEKEEEGNDTEQDDVDVENQSRVVERSCCTSRRGGRGSSTSRAVGRGGSVGRSGKDGHVERARVGNE